MNFTFEGLAAATNAIERLRTFHQRMLRGGFRGGRRMRRLRRRRRRRRAEFTAALANDLNTAEAAAAISEMVRAANSAADAGTLGEENAEEVLRVLALFDGVFAVLEDRDAELTRAALAWAEAEGRIGEAAPELVARLALSDAEIEALVEERTAGQEGAELCAGGRDPRGADGEGRGD